MDEYYVHYSTICECWWLMRIPAWAIMRAGTKGSWTNDDGDTYVPSEMATIVKDFDNRGEAEAYLRVLKDMQAWGEPCPFVREVMA